MWTRLLMNSENRAQKWHVNLPLPSVHGFRSKIIVLWVSLRLCIVPGSYKQEQTITKSFPDEFLKKIHFLPTGKVVVDLATFTMKRAYVSSIFPELIKPGAWDWVHLKALDSYNAHFWWPHRISSLRGDGVVHEVHQNGPNGSPYHDPGMTKQKCFEFVVSG